MQAGVTQGLRINRSHPDAVGCYFALPVMERGGNTVRDVAWNGSKGLGQPAWSGTRSYGNLRSGRAMSVSTGNTIATPTAGTPWVKDFSVCFSVQVSSFIASKGGFIRSGGFAIAHTASAGTLELHQDNVAVRKTSTVALSTGVYYTVGVRYRGSDNTGAFFVNGVKETFTASGAVVPASFTTSVFAAFNAAVATCLIRDIRIWNRFMPDVTFERYHTQPLAFYRPRAPFGLRGVVLSNAGRYFMPFMHPSFTS